MSRRARSMSSATIASFESKWWYRLPGRMPQASAMSLSDVRGPDAANKALAVSRISSRREPSLGAASTATSDEDRKGFPAPRERARHSRGVGLVDRPLGKPLEHLVECHPGFEPGQRTAEAVVDPEAEGEVVPLLTEHVEGVGGGE